jgi:hypothetical protein
MLLRFQKAAVRGNYETGNQAFSKRLRFLTIRLPGISEEEAATIVHSKLGLGLSQRKIQRLISKSRITDLRNGGKHSYVSARRLFWVIRELQAVAKAESTRARHQVLWQN